MELNEKLFRENAGGGGGGVEGLIRVKKTGLLSERAPEACLFSILTARASGRRRAMENPKKEVKVNGFIPT